MKKLYLLLIASLISVFAYNQSKITKDVVIVKQSLIMGDSTVTGFYSGFLTDTNDVNRRITARVQAGSSDSIYNPFQNTWLKNNDTLGFDSLGSQKATIGNIETGDTTIINSNGINVNMSTYSSNLYTIPNDTDPLREGWNSAIQFNNGIFRSYYSSNLYTNYAISGILHRENSIYGANGLVTYLNLDIYQKTFQLIKYGKSNISYYVQDTLGGYYFIYNTDSLLRIKPQSIKTFKPLYFNDNSYLKAGLTNYPTAYDWIPVWNNDSSRFVPSEVKDFANDTIETSSITFPDGTKQTTAYDHITFDSLYQQIIPVISLPDTIWINDSIECNIYYDNITLTDSYDNYSYYVDCLIGDNYSDFFRIYPDKSDGGLYELKIYLKNKFNNIIACDSTIIVIDTGNFVSSKNILLIGDSQTDQNVYPFYLNSLAGGQLVFIGTQDSGTDTPNEGYVGRDYRWFATNASSPFINSGAIDFSNYLSSNGLSTPDIIVFACGTNDIINSINSDVADSIASSLNWLDSLIKYARQDIPGAKICINTVMPPSYYQDAFYNYNQTANRIRTRNQFKYNYYLYNSSLFSRYNSDSVIIIPTNIYLDTKHNMKTGNVPINSRNKTIISRQNDAVHPDSSGYYQEADAIYSAIKSLYDITLGNNIISENSLDGSLETCVGCTPDDNISDNWNIWGETIGSGSIIDLTETAYDGNYAAKITYGSSTTNISLSIPVEQNTNYRLQFYTRGDGTNQGRYRIYDLTNSSDILSPALINTGVTSNEYTEVSVDFQTPSGCNNIRIYGYSSTVTSSIVYYDYFTLRKIY